MGHKTPSTAAPLQNPCDPLYRGRSHASSKPPASSARSPTLRSRLLEARSQRASAMALGRGATVRRHHYTMRLSASERSHERSSMLAPRCRALLLSSSVTGVPSGAHSTAAHSTGAPHLSSCSTAASAGGAGRRRRHQQAVELRGAHRAAQRGDRPIGLRGAQRGRGPERGGVE